MIEVKNNQLANKDLTDIFMSEYIKNELCIAHNANAAYKKWQLNKYGIVKYDKLDIKVDKCYKNSSDHKYVKKLVMILYLYSLQQQQLKGEKNQNGIRLKLKDNFTKDVRLKPTVLYSLMAIYLPNDPYYINRFNKDYVDFCIKYNHGEISVTDDVFASDFDKEFTYNYISSIRNKEHFVLRSTLDARLEFKTYVKASRVRLDCCNKLDKYLYTALYDLYKLRVVSIQTYMCKISNDVVYKHAEGKPRMRVFKPIDKIRDRKPVVIDGGVWSSVK